MSEVKWTNRQLDVINTRNRNILVSAAAGSGKTAVLVERIIKMITDSEDDTDIDRLLVVTFTRAAAGEMKERIRERLEKMAEDNPKDTNLRKQLSLIHNASISTIDSFCATIVKENFDKIDLDPNFRIADNTEIEMLKADCVSDLLEEYYEKADEDFMILAKQYSSGKIMDNLGELILELYKKSTGSINPKKWLEKCAGYYEADTLEVVEEMPFIIKLMEIAKSQVEDCLRDMDRALKITKEPDGPNYESKLTSFIESIEKIRDSKNYEEMRKSFNLIESITLANDKNCDQNKKKAVQSIKNDVNARLGKLKNKLFIQSLEEILYDIKKCKPSVDMIIKLTIEFTDRFTKLKEEKSIMDFNDQAHFALRILNDEDENGNLIPSDVAKEMSHKYKEIMIDEYQDSNFIQEAILSSVSRGQNINNMFMVGDVKQSIYRFRQAEPKLFLSKFDKYSESLDADNCKIILDRNFRSRKEVVDAINSIFDFIMNKNVGGIDYRDGNGLVTGATFEPVSEGQDNVTEALLVEGGEKKDEASYVAEKILEITDSVKGMKVTGKDGKLRPAKFSDITILLRSLKGNGEIYLEELENKGIPAYSESKTGYYETIEIKTIMSMLTIIDNPRQDIPLATVLKSPMFKFSDEEFAIIKSENLCDDFYDNIMIYAANGAEFEIIEKINRFIYLLNKYRDMVNYTGVYDLINEILKDTGYDYYISAMPNGKRRHLNIEALKQKAVNYENISYKGLFNFVRYIEKIQYLDVDDGEASTSSENDNAVKIMTIHKSKGLQFPIVFLCNTTGKMKPDTDKIAVDDEGGIGVDFIDEELHLKSPTLIKNVIRMENLEEEMAERQRILYVALTRAQEKLFIVARCKDLEKTMEKCSTDGSKTSDIMSYSEIVGAGNMFDWMLKTANESASIELKTIEKSDVEISEIKNVINESSKEKVIELIEKSKPDSESEEKIKNTFSFVYPYVDDITMKSKASVTEIKKDRLNSSQDEEAENFFDEKEEELPKIIPKFEEHDISMNERLTGAKRGTAYHRVFELLDMDCENYTVNTINEMIDDFVKKGYMEMIEADSIYIKDIVEFTKSSLFKRMKEAEKNNSLFREKKFLMGLPARKFSEEDIEVIESPKEGEEIMIVQGIIDVCFLEDGEYVIADYKTDNVDTMEELVKRYKIQLECYKIAIEKISGIKVRDMIIYSVKLGQEIKI